LEKHGRDVLLITDVKVQHIETVAVAVQEAVVTAVVFVRLCR
jgi:hypothetical protein